MHVTVAMSTICLYENNTVPYPVARKPGAKVLIVEGDLVRVPKFRHGQWE